MYKSSARGLLTSAALLALSVPFSATPTFAEEADTSASRLDAIVVTANRREQPIADVQASVEVIGQEEIQTYSGASVTETLRQSVGVDARTSGANSTVSIRGQIPNAGSAVLVLFDGIPRTGKFGITNLNNYPVEDVERIEIIRGPMSALYGANAAGGVINIITKGAGSGDALTIRTTAGTSLSAKGGGRESYSVAGSFNAKTGNIGHRVSIDYRSAEPFEFEESVRVDDLTGIDHLSLTYSGIAELGETSDLRWTFEGFTQDDRSDGRTRTGVNFERFEKEDRFFGSLAYYGIVGPGDLSVEGSYGYSDGTANRSFPGPDETTEFTQTILQGRYAVPVDAHNLLFGLGAQRDEIELTTLSQVGKETNRFVFAQDEWDINDDIRLVMGVRLDDFDSFGTEIVPRISIGSRGDGFTWRAGYGEAFRAPSVIERFASFTRGRFLIIGATNIQPEETETFEGAIGWRNNRFVTELVVHSSDVDNLIQASPNGQTVGALTVFEYQNIAKAEITGVELTGSANLGSGFHFDGSYEFLDAVDAQTGSRLNGRARNTLKAALSYEDDGWGGTIRGRYIGNLWGIDPANRARPAFSDDYTVFDMNGHYEINEAVSLSVGIDNLFDQRTPPNWSSTGAIEDPAGRFGYVSLTYKLGAL